MLLQKSQTIHFLMLFVMISRTPRNNNKSTVLQIQEGLWCDPPCKDQYPTNKHCCYEVTAKWLKKYYAQLSPSGTQFRLNNFVFESSRSQHAKNNVLALLDLETGQWDDKLTASILFSLQSPQSQKKEKCLPQKLPALTLVQGSTEKRVNISKHTEFLKGSVLIIRKALSPNANTLPTAFTSEAGTPCKPPPKFLISSPTLKRKKRIL